MPEILSIMRMRCPILLKKNATRSWQRKHLFSNIVKVFLASLLVLNATAILAQVNLWTPTSPAQVLDKSEQLPDLPDFSKGKLFDLDLEGMIALGQTAKQEDDETISTTATLWLPMPDGSLTPFRIWESSIMEPGLAAKFPEIKTYVIRGLEDHNMTGRMTVSPHGFNAFFASLPNQKEVIIQKISRTDPTKYLSFNSIDNPLNLEPYECNWKEDKDKNLQESTNEDKNMMPSANDTGDTLRVFRIALTAPGMLCEQQGWTTKAQATAGLISFLAQINVVYERDLSTRFVLINNNEELIFLDSSTDPFDADGGRQYIGYNITLVNQVIGPANYDLGIVFPRSGCCAALRPSVCNDHSKAGNYSRYNSLTTTCHEIGHQFSSVHTWTYCNDPGGNGSSELGGGITIMGYGNRCNNNTIIPLQNTNFIGVYSQVEMTNYINSKSCYTELPTGNHIPNVTVPPGGFYIPISTPYKLEGSATDADNDPLSYSWEPYHLKGVDFTTDNLDITVPPVAADGNVPLVRTFNPVSVPSRTIPQISDLLLNNSTVYERLPTYSRNLKYRFIVRDNHPGSGGVSHEELSFEVDGTAGPFLVTSPNTCVTWSEGSTQTVTWDVANTDNANINCQNVNILLSIDGGYTYPYTLATSTANDGSESITLPSGVCSNLARIKVESDGNIFFDISNENFQIDDSGATVTLSNALQLDGVNDYVDATDGVYFDGDFTIEAWVYPKTFASWQRIIDFGNGAADDNILFSFTSGTSGHPVLRVYNGSNYSSINTSNPISTNEWTHIAVTLSGTTATIYVNGSVENTSTFSYLPANVTRTNCYIGKSNWNDPYADAIYDEIRIWDIARTQTEIQDNKDCSLTGSESGLTLYYPMNHTICGSCSNYEAGIIQDESTNNNDGALLEGAYTSMSTADVQIECPTCTAGDVTITGDPSNQNVALGATATFTVTATGTNLAYQWERSTDNGTTFNHVQGETNSTYSFTAQVTHEDNEFRCLVGNGCDVDTSMIATLTLNCTTPSLSSISGPTAPCINNYYTYYVDPNAEVVNWVWTTPAGWIVSNFNNMIFVYPSGTAGDVTVYGEDACGNTTSTQTLAVTPVLVEITTEPVSQTVTEGNAANFSVTVATGGGTTNYQWEQSIDQGLSFFNISGATSSTLNIASADLSHDNRKYRCILSNDCLLDTSTVVTLDVNCATSAPKIPNSIIGSNFVCQTISLVYSVTPVPGATGYTWTLPGGWSGSSSTNSITVTTGTSGGILKVKATNSCGDSDERALDISVSSSACLNAIHVDGQDDFLSVDQNNIDLLGDLSVSFWIYPEKLSGNQTVIYNGREFHLTIMNDNTLRFRHGIRFGGYSSTAVIDLAGNFKLNKWQFVAVTRDTTSRTIKLYLDGVLVETDTYSTDDPQPGPNTQDDMIFGAGIGGFWEKYTGRFDDIKIWDDVRSDAEVFDDMFCVPTGSESNLIAYYGFETGQPNGDNTSISSFANSVASSYPSAEENNLAMDGPTSNITDGSKGQGGMEGPDVLCSGSADYIVDFPGTPTVTWTLPTGWTGTSTTETITATAGANGGIIKAEATLGCGTVTIEKAVGTTPPIVNTALPGGKGLDLDGTDDQLYLESGEISLSNSSMTIEFWAKRKSTGGRDLLIDQGSSAGNERLHIGFRETSNYFTFAYYGNDLNTTIGYDDLSWHHWACVYDKSISSPGDNRFIYRDGEIVASDRTDDDYEGSGTFYIGNYGSDYFDGLIDEFRVWDIARSQTEIKSYLWCPEECPSPDLILYLPFEEGEVNGNNTGSTTVLDYSSYNKDCFFNNFALTGTSSNYVNGLVTPDVTGSEVVCPLLSWEYSIPAIEGATAYTWSLPSGWTGTSSTESITVSPSTTSGTIQCDVVAPCGTLSFTKAVTANTACNTGLDLDGTDDYVDVVDGVYFDGDFTAEAWVYPRSYNNWSRLFDFGNGSGNAVVALALTSGTSGYPQFITYDASSSTDLTSSEKIPLNEWTHIAATLSGTTGKIYFNGVEVASGTMVAPHNVVRTNCYIGKSNWPDAHPEAIYDEFRIWDEARTPTQIQETMFCPMTTPPSSVKLYLPFEDGIPDGNNTETLSTQDLSGNEMHGTLFNLALTGTSSNYSDATKPKVVTGADIVCPTLLWTYSVVPVSGATSYTWTLPSGWTGSSTTNSITVTPSTTNGTVQCDVVAPCGTLSFTKSVTANPACDNVLDLDGSGDKLWLGHANEYGNFGTGDFTIETWVKTTDSKGAIYSKRNSCASTDYMAILINGGNLLFELRGFGQSNLDLSTTAAVSDGNWHHVAVTRSGSDLKIYKDGEIVASGTSNHDISNTYENRMGYLDGCSSSWYYDGAFDEVRIWDVARTREEIIGNWHCPITSYPISLILYLPFEEGLPNQDNTGITHAMDFTSNGYDAVIETLARTGNTSNYIADAKSLDVRGSSVVCPQLDWTFSVPVVAGATSYTWTVPSGWTGTSSTDSITVTPSTTSGIVQCIVASSCGDLTFTKSVTANPACDNSLHFNDDNDYLTLNNEIGNFGTNDFTIETWIKTNDASGSIFTKRDGCGCPMFGLYFESGKLRLEVSDPGCSATDNYYSIQTINDGAWHHIALVRSGTTLTFYVDGFADEILTSNHDINNSSTTRIGHNTCSSGWYTDGYMDEFRVWSVARTQAELKANMFCLMNSYPSTLQLYLPFEDGVKNASNTSNTYTLDHSNYGNHATFTNFALTGTTSNYSDAPDVSRYLDNDGDGFGDPGTSTINFYESCDYVVLPGDCNDSDSAIHPYAAEICGNMVDENCDGETDLITNVALSLDGVNDHVPTTNVWAYQPPFTLEAWVKTTGNNIHIMTWDAGVSSSHNVIMYVRSNGSLSYGENDGGWNSWYSGPVINDGNWHHVVVIRTASNLTFVTDGVEYATVSLSKNPVVTEFTLGGLSYKGSNVFDGSLDELRVWDTALTITQINERMHRRLDGNETNLVRYYPFDHGDPGQTNTAFTIAKDHTSNNADGTLSGFALTGASSNWVGSWAYNSYIDADSDGYGGTTLWTCGTMTNTTTHNLDCDDSDNTIHPYADEICGNGKDDDCEGNTDVEINKGLDFDGSGHNVSIPLIEYEEFFTVEAWVKIPNISGWNSRIFEWQGKAAFSIYNNKIAWDEGGGNYGGPDLFDGEWHHVAMVHNGYTGTNIIGYVDGIQRFSTSRAYDPSVNTATNIGRNFTGSIDDVRYWDVVLTQSQIQERMNKRIEGNETNLVCYYTFDHGVLNTDNSIYTIAKDKTSNNADGTLSGFALTGVTSNWVESWTYNRYLDNDSDGFGGSTAWTCGTMTNTTDHNLDCNDSDNAIHPGATDICGNNIDENCNGVNDENTLSLDFDGSNDEVNFGNTLGNFGTGDFAIEGRIKTTTKNRFILSKRGVCGCDNFFNVAINGSGNLRMELYENGSCGNGGNIVGTSDVTDGNWHHFAVNRVNGVISIYVDGIIEVSSTNTTDLDNTADLIIGNNPCGSRFEGEIDELRIWDIGLTPEGIDDLKNASVPATVSGLIAYYDFNNPDAIGGGNNSGQTNLDDRTSNNYDGTLSNFTLDGSSSNWLGNPGTTVTWYADTDSDGYGDPASTKESCFQPTGYVSDNTDCDDTDTNVNPGATEICNLIDDDCDGMVDEGFSFSTYYLDSDGDTYGDPNVDSVACSQPVDYVLDNTDCDDTNGSVNPGATEICNLIDDDCDGMVDEGFPLNTYYADQDGDTFGDPNTTTTACSPPAGYVVDNTDCQPNNPSIYPGATEVLNGLDDDCDGTVDEGASGLPETGISIPCFTTLEDSIKNFIDHYDIPGVTVAFGNGEKIYYMRAFGYADLNDTEFAEPYHRGRIASVSKPVTMVAILKLIQDGQLNFSDKVFGPGSILGGNAYYSGYTDSRIDDITVQHLFDHKAGFDRDFSDCFPSPTLPYNWTYGGCDPIATPLAVTLSLGETNPVSKEALIKFLLEKGLDHDPGAEYHYSNIGYLILGRIITEVSGIEYETYLKENIMESLGVCDMSVGGNYLSDKQEREWEYHASSTSLDIDGSGKVVNHAYGTANINAGEAHGGWIASARDLVTLFAATNGLTAKPDILNGTVLPHMAQGFGGAWNAHNAYWKNNTSNGMSFAMIINERKDPGNPDFSAEFFGGLATWVFNNMPTCISHDLMLAPIDNSDNFSFTNIQSTSSDVSWTVGNGDKRIVVAKAGSEVDAFPKDGLNYTANAAFGSGTDLGNGNFVLYDGNGTSFTATNLIPGTNYHLRVFEYNQNSNTGDYSLYKRCDCGLGEITPGITTDPISSPICAGSTINVDYASNGYTFNGGNTFTAELSDASGSFSSPVNIGTLSSTSSSGTISCTIPGSTAAGTQYRIRVTSSDPASTGAANKTDLTINALLTWYQDTDGDGFGNSSVTSQSCTKPPGFVDNGNDCNDADVNIHPFAEEICSNSIDDNCDGVTDAVNNRILSFDGVDDFISTSPSQMPSTFTLEAWVKVGNTGTHTIAAWSNNFNYYGRLIVENGAVKFTASDGPNNAGWATGSYVIGNNTWSHIAFVRNSDTYKIYVDGVLRVTNNFTVAYTTDTLTIGTMFWQGMTSNHFQGEMDEVRIWSDERTAAEIACDYETDLAGNEPDLLRYFGANIGSAGSDNIGLESLKDESTNATHATLHNFALTGSSSNYLSGNTALRIISAGVDSDGDGYYSCLECDDTDANIHPYADEICGNSTDDNCDGNTDSEVNKALHFDGVNDIVQLPYVAPPSNMTIETWVKASNTSGSHIILNWIGTSPTNTIEFYLNGGQVYYGEWDGSWAAFGGTQIGDNNWHHVAVVKNGSSLTMYIDGERKHTTTISKSLTLTDLNLGHIDWNANTDGIGNHARLFDGSMDEVRIWDAALSQTQIVSRMNRRLIGNETNLIRYYPFEHGIPANDNSVMEQLLDKTSNNAHGTLKKFALAGATSNWVSSWNYSLYADNDNDGHGGSTAWDCGSMADYYEYNVDCDDSDSAIHPYATEVCGNGEDDNCDGDTDSELNRTLHFDGVDDIVQLPYMAPTSTMTIEAWVKANNASGSHMILNWIGTSPTHTIELYLNSGNILYLEWDGSGASIGGTQIGDNTWHHVAVVKDGSSASMYIDGDLKHSGTISKTLTLTDLNLGHIDWDANTEGYGNHDRFFNGSMDEVRIWDVALTQTQIIERMNKRLLGSETNLVRYHTFDYGNASNSNVGIDSLQDLTSNNADGTMKNFALSGATSNWISSFTYDLYEDIDNDNFGSSTIWSCGPMETYKPNNLDCDDTDDDISPEASDICGSTVDENCNGVTDENALLLNFDGTDDYVNLGNTIANFGAGDFTIEFRVKTTGNTQYFLSKSSTVITDPRFSIQMDVNGRVLLLMWETGLLNFVSFTGNEIVNDGDWHHIALIREGDKVTLLVDGALDISTSGTITDLTSNSNDWVIGYDPFYNGYLNGEMDEVRFWNVARSDYDLDLLKAAVLPVPQTGLQAYYDFNNPNATGGGNNSGETTLDDRTSNNNDGTLTNFALNGDVSNWLSTYPRLNLKMFLQGAYNTSTDLMNDNLRSSGLIPLEEPYTDIGYTFAGNGGGEIIDTTILYTTGDDAIIDWAVIEIRDNDDSTSIIHAQAVLIQRDGDIVDLDGASPVEICEINRGEHFIALLHRNHFGIMTPNTIDVDGVTTTSHDYTTGMSQAWDDTSISTNDAMLELETGVYGVYRSNVNFDEFLNITDFFVTRGATNPSQSSQYELEDVNMDGVLNIVDFFISRISSNPSKTQHLPD